MRKPPVSLMAIALCATSGIAQASPDSGWDWMMAPYLWAASVGTDVETTSPPSSSSNDTTFDDLFDKIDGAFQVHAEGQGDEFGVFADFTYLGLADETDLPRFRTENDLDSRLLDVAVVWSPGPVRMQGFEAFGGLRAIDLDFTAQLIPRNPAFQPVVLDTNETFQDFMLGARYTWALSDRWGLTLRGDASWGDTDGTFNASVVGNYRTDSGAWLFGYRYLDIDVEPTGQRINVTLSGPMIGYGFRF